MERQLKKYNSTCNDLWPNSAPINFLYAFLYCQMYLCKWDFPTKVTIVFTESHRILSNRFWAEFLTNQVHIELVAPYVCSILFLPATPFHSVDNVHFVKPLTSNHSVNETLRHFSTFLSTECNFVQIILSTGENAKRKVREPKLISSTKK